MAKWIRKAMQAHRDDEQEVTIRNNDLLLVVMPRKAYDDMRLPMIFTDSLARENGGAIVIGKLFTRASKDDMFLIKCYYFMYSSGKTGAHRYEHY